MVTEHSDVIKVFRKLDLTTSAAEVIVGGHSGLNITAVLKQAVSYKGFSRY